MLDLRSLSRHRRSDQLYLFLHLPRCAGTFLLQSFARLGKKRMIVVADSPQSKQAALDYLQAEVRRRNIRDPGRLQLIAGHDVFLGMHQVSRRKPYYFVFMRDPVERFLSNYRYLLDCAEDIHSPVQDFARRALFVQGKPLRLEELIDQGRLANMMTHYLAAAVDPNLSTGRWHVQDVHQLQGMARYCLTQTRFIGFYDRLQQDAERICRQIGVPLRRGQVNRTRHRIEEPLGPTMVARIRELNLLDCELFEHARQLRAQQDV